MKKCKIISIKLCDRTLSKLWLHCALFDVVRRRQLYYARAHVNLWSFKLSKFPSRKAHGSGSVASPCAHGYVQSNSNSAFSPTWSDQQSRWTAASNEKTLHRRCCCCTSLHCDAVTQTPANRHTDTHSPGNGNFLRARTTQPGFEKHYRATQ